MSSPLLFIYINLKQKHFYKYTLECPQLSNKYILELSNKLSTIVKNVCFPIHSRSESFVTKKDAQKKYWQTYGQVSYSADSQCIVILYIKSA